MFRSKKGVSQGVEPVIEAPGTPDPAVPSAAVEPTKSEPRRGIPFPAGRPLPHTAFPLDISRRSSELTQLAGRGGETGQVAGSKDKQMTIGRDVELRGEVCACDRLVVDGSAQLTVTGARMLQIGASGVFSGTADVAKADVGGRFDGELTVRERLTIRASGQVRGRVRYGQIVIEAGGELSGDVGTLDGQVRVTAGEPIAAAELHATLAPFADAKMAAPTD